MLPKDIFYILWELLGVDMNALILSSSILYRMCAPEMYWWDVHPNLEWGTNALVLYLEEIIPGKILSRIHNPQRQLGLTLKRLYPHFLDVSALGGVHTLDLSDCRGVVDVSALGGVHTLDLSDCHGVVDVSALGGVLTLDLTD